MKVKVLALGLACLLFTLIIYSQSLEEKSHFRNTYWGMSKEQVIEIEGIPKRDEIVEGLNTIVYDSKINEKRCAIIFFFAENKLVSSKYHFLHKHVNRNLYIFDYDSLKKNLIKKYGESKEHKVIWLNNLYKNKPNDIGRAFSYGHVRLFTKWETQETNIFLGMMGDNYKIKLIIEYSSIKYTDLKKKIKEKAKKKIW